MRFLRGSLTLSAANAITRGSFNTNLSALGITAMRIYQIDVEVATLDTPADNDIADWAVCLSDPGTAALALVSDSDTVAKQAMEIGLVTSGAFMYNRVFTYTFQFPIDVFKEELWFQASTNGQASATTFYFRIHYVPIDLTETQAARIFRQ